MISTALHALIRQLSDANTTLVVLEGSTCALSDVNQWALLGVGCRQSLKLVGSQLEIHTHPPNQSQQSNTLTLTDAEDLWPLLRSHLNETRSFNRPHALPFTGGWVTLIGYEFAPWCEPALAPSFHNRQPIQPSLWCVECETWLLVNTQTAELTVLSEHPEEETFYTDLWQQLLQQTESEKPSNLFGTSGEKEMLQSFAHSLSPEAFSEKVEQLKTHIRQGEIYQANLSIRFEKNLTGVDPVDLYTTLSNQNPSPWSGLWKSNDQWLICNSPERLVSIDKDERLETRPIAGTRGRGKTPVEDDAIGTLLKENDKEQAEHAMLVDLARNDLGRVCQPGSVTVPHYLTLERYSHVTHLVSHVIGQKQPGLDAFDILKALFPGGTITGCPKIRCMEILNTLEPVPRGFYTGSLGYLDRATGSLDLNILIRSLWLEPTEEQDAYTAYWHAGAGIVADSIGPYEYRECLRKASMIQLLLTRLTEQGSSFAGDQAAMATAMASSVLH